MGFAILPIFGPQLGPIFISSMGYYFLMGSEHHHELGMTVDLVDKC